MEEVMIQAAHVSMRFYRELNEANSVKERLVRMWKGERQVVEVKALKAGEAQSSQRFSRG